MSYYNDLYTIDGGEDAHRPVPLSALIDGAAVGALAGYSIV